MEFDEASHTYTIDGCNLPSVTTVLKEAGIINVSGPWFTEWHRERGDYVHLATELFDRDLLDRETIDEEISGFVRAWEKFRAESDCKVIQIECRLHHPTYRYAGTADRSVIWNGVQTVIDIKTGPPAPWHALQTAAYAACLPGTVGRACVYLEGCGSFKVARHNDFNDFDIFRSALAVYKWKEMNK